MYRFLEYTVGQYMTRQVKTVTRETTLRELEALFARHDFNAFPVMEGQELEGRFPPSSLSLPSNVFPFLSPTSAGRTLTATWLLV
jgi:CBS-domain-containing membrane protein